MKNTKELLKTLGEKLISLSATEAVEENPEGTKVEMAATAVKEDGTEIATPADEFAVGVEVYVMEGDEPAPAPDGEHMLQDGSKVVVKDGLVESIDAPAEEEEMSEDKYVSKADFEKFASDVSEFHRGLLEAIGGVDQNLSAVSKDIESKDATIKELEGKLEAAEQKLSETPATESVKGKKPVTSKVSLSEFRKMNEGDRIKALRENPELAKELRKK